MRGEHGWVKMEDHNGAIECAVILCAHCQAVIFMTPKARANVAWCGRCKAIVCPRCHVDGRCTPFERRLDTLER